MKIYNYSPKTGEFLFSSEATPDPLELDRYLIPANATVTQPLPDTPGMARVFKDGSWALVVDNRGKVWDKETAVESEWGVLGALPSTLTKLKPPAEYPLWDGSKWVVDRNAMIAEMRQRIKAERDSRTSGGVRMDTFWYPSDGESRILYLDWKDQARDQLAAGALKTDPLLVDDVQAVIERLDGISQNLTIDNIFTLVDKCRRLMRKLDVAMKAHIEAMKVATDPSAYDYKTTLWPNRYN